MPETVVIVGAGVTGLSTAYHLARRGRHRIMVVDKGPVGDGSSSRAAAIITGLLWSETGVRARRIALDRYRELSSELDGYRFRDVGCLNLFDPESWPARESLLPIYDRCEAPYEILVRGGRAAGVRTASVEAPAELKDRLRSNFRDYLPALDVAAFSPDRFPDAETEAYLAETVKQRDVVRRRH